MYNFANCFYRDKHSYTTHQMNDTFKLAAIFLLSLAIFALYSLVPEEVAEYMHIRQISLGSGDTFRAAGEPADSVAAAEAGQETLAVVPTDTTRQVILLFGDSMSQPLALRLSDYAARNGHSLTCVTWNGSGTKTWAESDTLDYYIRQLRPTQIFVCLGSNELYTKDMKGCRTKVTRIMQRMGNVPFVWIGPPNWCEDNGINDLIEQIVGKRRFFRTKGMEFERQQDGRHPTYSASVVWMDSIVGWINAGHSLHPIRLEKPEKRCVRYSQLFISNKKQAHGAQPADSAAVESPATQEGDMPAEPHAPVEAKPRGEAADTVSQGNK